MSTATGNIIKSYESKKKLKLSWKVQQTCVVADWGGPEVSEPLFRLSCRNLPPLFLIFITRYREKAKKDERSIPGFHDYIINMAWPVEC